MKLRTAALILICICNFTHPVHAQLEWATADMKVSESMKSDKPVVVEFPFKNTGKYTVKIKRLETDCGCTVARAASLVVAAGQSSIVTVRFVRPHRYGVVEHMVVVYTDDPARPVKFLHLKVTPV